MTINLVPRVIPILLLSGTGFVKTKRFKNPRYIGDPVNIVKIFNEKCVDELVILNIDSSIDSDTINLLEDIASECFVPLAYGGGIRSLNDAQRILDLGFEKIVLQTALFSNHELVRSISYKYGAQAVVASIDIKSDFLGRLHPYISHTRRLLHNASIDDTLKAVSTLGIGEILIQHVNREGTRHGLDHSLLSRLPLNLGVPIVFSGGTSSDLDIQQSFQTGISGLGVGAFFCYHGPLDGVLISYTNPFVDPTKLPKWKV